jgi:hypothetical protein
LYVFNKLLVQCGPNSPVHWRGSDILSDIDHFDSAVLAPFHGARRRPRPVRARFLLGLFFFACLIYGALFTFLGPFAPRLFVIPLGVFAALIVWALPEMKRYPDRTMSWCFFAFAVALICWPNYLAIALPGLPWITLTRLVSVPMALSFLVCISVSKAFRRELVDINKAAPSIATMVLIFAITEILTIPLSKHLFVSMQKVVTAQVTQTILFFVGAYVFARPGRARLWSAIFCLTLVAISLIGIKEFHDSRLPWVGHIPSFLKINDEAVLRTLAGGAREGAGYRIETTFATSLGLGEYAGLLMPFLLYYMTDARKVWVRVLAGAAVPLLITLVLWSDSRLGLIGGMLGAIIFAFLRAVRHWRSVKGSFWGPAIVLGYPALAIAAFASTFVVHRIYLRVWGVGQYDASNQARKEMYQTGIPMILNAPWGHGSGNGAETLGFYTPGGLLTIDTYLLRVGLEFGIIGLVVFIAMFGTAAWISGRKILDLPPQKSEYDLFMPLASSLLVFLFAKTVYAADDNHPLVFAMLGMVVGLCARLRNEALARKSGASAANVMVWPELPARSRPKRLTAGP